MENDVEKTHITKLSGKLNDLDKKLEELKTKAASSAGTVKAEYEKTINELRGKRKELKKGTKKAIDSMSKSIDNAIRKFKK